MTRQSTLVVQTFFQNTMSIVRGRGDSWSIHVEVRSNGARSPGIFSQHANAQNIPASKLDAGVWMYESAGKADLLEQAFSCKCFLPELIVNEYREFE